MNLTLVNGSKVFAHIEGVYFARINDTHRGNVACWFLFHCHCLFHFIVGFSHVGHVFMDDRSLNRGS